LNNQRSALLIVDLRFFPEELHSVYSTTHDRHSKTVKSTVKRATFDETLAKLRDFEKRDNTSGSQVNEDENGESADGVDGEGEDENENDEAVYEEEELEDETDYNLNYFDNGEDYGDHDDGDGKNSYGFAVSSCTDRTIRWTCLLANP